MRILGLKQGSNEWLAARFKYHTASEAPAMIGVHPNVSRSDLLRAKYNGDEKEISGFVQEHVFDKGHEVEALVRPAIEKELGEDLFPCTVTDDDGYLSASLDGMTMNRSVIWEHKQFSQAKVDYINEHEGGVPEADYLQVQQQLLVTGAKRCLYTVGNDPDNLARVWVEPNKGAFEDIRSGWAQFDQDLENYKPGDVVAEAVGHTMESLPALRIELTGMVKASNLVAYKDHALAVFDAINTELQTDQDFADAENTVKWCKDVEDRLDAAKQHALSQTEDIDTLFRALDDLKASARQKRLELDKLVKARKLIVRDEIRQGAAGALAEHMSGLEDRLDKRVRIPQPVADFAAAMKGKRTITSLRDAVDQVLAEAKIASSAQADAIQTNLKTFDELAVDYLTLFPDLEQLSYKAPDDFTAAVKLRISEHKEAEEKRIVNAAIAAKATREVEAAEEAAKKAFEDVAPPKTAMPSAAAPIGMKQPQAGAGPLARPHDPEPENGAATRSWQVTATFDVVAPEKYGAEEIIGRMRNNLSGFKSLANVTAFARVQTITNELLTADEHGQLI